MLYTSEVVPFGSAALRIVNLIKASFNSSYVIPSTTYITFGSAVSSMSKTGTPLYQYQFLCIISYKLHPMSFTLTLTSVTSFFDLIRCLTNLTIILYHVYTCGILAHVSCADKSFPQFSMCFLDYPFSRISLYHISLLYPHFISDHC